MIIRTELFRTLGGYDTALTCGEDLDLLCRLVASGYRLIYLNEPLYRYVRRSGSITSSHTIRERPEDLLRVMTKLDPRVEHEGYCSPLSVREFACFQCERLLRLAWAEVVAGDRATAQEYLARIGELPGPAVIHRLLHRLSGRTWPVTKLLLAANRRMKAVHHYCRRWGVRRGGEVPRRAWGCLGEGIRQRRTAPASACLKPRRSRPTTATAEARGAIALVPEPLVSIIVPAYNEEQRISAALESLRAQTWPNLEVIVVNDGSTDDTSGVVRRGFPEVTLVEKENEGLARAYNSGAEVAHGEYIGFLDADDRFAPEKTARQMEVLLGEPNVGAVGTNGMVFSGPLQYPAQSPRWPRLKQISVLDIFNGIHPIGTSVMLPMVVFNEIGRYGHEVRRQDDLDLFRRVITAGKRVLLLNEPLYLITRHFSSRSTQSFTVRVEDILDTTATMDPRSHPAAAKVITPEEYSEVAGRIILRGLYHAWCEDDRALIDRLFRRAAELPVPPRSLAGLDCLATDETWQAFGRLVRRRHTIEHLRRMVRQWGVIGAVQHMLVLRREEQLRTTV